MGINSQSQALMDKIRAKKGIPLFLNTVARVREANIRQYCTDPPLVEIGKTQDVFVPCPWGMLRIKLYYPKEFMQQDCALLPVVVFYHGGGWTVDTVETHDKAVHVMCASSGCVFASVDYRLAPENRFPAGIEDAYNGFMTMLRRLALTVRKLRFAEIVRVETLQLLYVKWQETAAVFLSAIRF